MQKLLLHQPWRTRGLATTSSKQQPVGRQPSNFNAFTQGTGRIAGEQPAGTQVLNPPFHIGMRADIPLFTVSVYGTPWALE